jgi:hypothetical protein
MADNKEELIFAEGLYFSKPNPNGPKSIKARIGINVATFGPIAKKYEKKNGFIDIDIRWSEKGKFYATVNTFEPKAKAEDDGTAGLDLGAAPEQEPGF